MSAVWWFWGPLAIQGLATCVNLNLNRLQLKRIRNFRKEREVAYREFGEFQASVMTAWLEKVRSDIETHGAIVGERPPGPIVPHSN